MSGLLVVVGALVGAPLRMWTAQVAVRRGRDAALATLVVNVVGSAVLGGLLGVGDAPGWAVVLVGTGFCGALTTFSTFGADAVRLLDTRSAGRALAYVLASLVLGIGAAAGAHALASAL